MTIPNHQRPLDEARYRETLGHFASGITIVTALQGETPTGVTCQAFSALSLDPPLIVLGAGNRSTSWPSIIEAGTFCVNVLASDQEALARIFATSGANKFEGVGWSTSVSGAPVLDGILAYVDCAVESILAAGDHQLVIGRVLDLGTNVGHPLLFHRGGFAELRH